MFTHMLKTSDPIRSAWQWVVLLVLFGFPLACDRNPTAPVSTPRPSIETSLLPLGVPSVFDGSHYLGLDLNYAVQFQYGLSAKAVLVSNHLYGWRAQVGNQLYPIDMQRAVHDLYGWDYTLAAVGVGPYDWRAVNFWAMSSPYTYTVLPVMLIASDYFYDVGAVQRGLTNFESVLITTRNWYAKAMTTYGGPSKTFRLLQPLVVFNQSSRTAAQWNALSYQVGASGLVSAAVQEYYNSYVTVPYGVRQVLVPFTGSNTGVSGLGGFNSYDFRAVAPPQASGVTCPATGALSALCTSATYWVGHELGRSLGLSETSCGPTPWGTPLCATSIMNTPATALDEPQDAALTPDEIQTLFSTGYFF
jgi:hypothetical protein